MRRRWSDGVRASMAAVLLVALGPRVEAQTVTVNADRLRLTGGPCVISSVDGSPDKIRFDVCPVLTTAAATNLTLNPTGDLVLGPAGNDVLPNLGYTQNLGALANKYLTLHAAELWVETLVAQNTIATIGGRVLVAPTTTLTADVLAADTAINVKHNEMAAGDRIYLEANGKVEFMAVTSGPGGPGPYIYSVTRNLDGSGANDWYAGDAVLNTGTTGDGFIDLYSVAGVLSGAGPTIVGNVRTNTTYNAIAPRWAIGNLNGLYGYGATTYGAAFGDAAATNVTVDATNGFRIRSGTTNKLVADTSGNLALTGDLSVGASGVVRSSTATGLSTGDGFYLQGGSTPAFRIGNPSGNRLLYDASTGTLSLYGNGNGLTSIGPGSLTVGLGRNMIRNSDCAVGTVDWVNGSESGLTQTFGVALTGYRLHDQTNTCYLTLAGTPTAGHLSYAYTADASRYPVIAAARYEASAYLGVHRAGSSYVSIQWFDSSGTFLSLNNGTSCTTASVGGLKLADFCRSGVVAAAPTNATTARVVIYTTHTAEANPYVFFVHTYFGEALSGQTDLTPWGPAGLTEIVGGMIRTGTIVADNIAAGAITAAKISVSSLSAIAADIGTITAGTMTGVTATFGGTVTLNSSGVTISQGTGTLNSVNWSDSTRMYSSSGAWTLLNSGGGSFSFSGTGGYVADGSNFNGFGKDLGSSSNPWGATYTTSLTLGSGTITKSGWSGGGTRAICVDNNGDVFRAGGTSC